MKFDLYTQITYVLTSTPTTSSGLQDVTLVEFKNGSVIAVLSLTYESTSQVDVDDIDGILTSSAESESLTDGTDSIAVESQSITGKFII